MPDESLKQLLASAQLAFSGDVEATGRSGVPGVRADERTVVVRVDRPIQVPDGLQLPPGSRVTVQLSPELPALEAGESATFFVGGLVYGDTLVVSEIGRASAEETAVAAGRKSAPAAPASPLDAAVAELAVDEVVEHARTADAVIRAHVVGLAHVPNEGPPDEHSPDWWIAELEVDLLVSGGLAGGAQLGPTVSVLYANSLDVRWRDSPKPKAGQSGLWLLHRTESPELAGLAPFQLLHPIDLQPSLQLDVLRQRGLAPTAEEQEREMTTDA